MNKKLQKESDEDVREVKIKYGNFLFDKEEILYSHQLIRDQLIFTNFRLLYIQKQGGIERRRTYKTILYSSITDVTLITQERGPDDSEIEITCFDKKVSSIPESTHFLFPNNTDITFIYLLFGNIVLKNKGVLSKNEKKSKLNRTKKSVKK